MFWTLLLCHLVADYPLQTDAVVKAKKRLPGLVWHVLIHFVTMLVVVLGIAGMAWRDAVSAILIVTVCHFLIDLWKNILERLRPGWVIFGYLQDQLLHLISLAAVAYWIEKSGGPSMLVNQIALALPAIGYLLVTHAWFVTERVLSHRKPHYHAWVKEQAWSRMIGRAAMFTAPFIGWDRWAALIALIGVTHHWLDLAGPYHYRALVTDGAVVAAAVLLSAPFSS